jgi:hypothetical protein
MSTLDQFVHIATLGIYEADYLMSIEEKVQAQSLTEEELTAKYKFIQIVSENVLDELGNSPEYQDIL